MSETEKKLERHPFPPHRPDIVITPSRAKPFAVDLRELPWWFCPIGLGRECTWTTYYPPEWRLSSVAYYRGVRPARVHNLDCVEIEGRERELRENRGETQWLIYARLTDDAAQWLATFRILEGRRILYTFLDEGFEEDFGEVPRRLEDRGRYVLQKDGSYRQRKGPRYRARGAMGAGIFRVKIGPRAFTCLRVLDTDGTREPDEKGVLFEAYLTRSGRTVLGRRYNGRLWAAHKGSAYAGPPWDERFPENPRLVIDRVTYVLWYDCLSDIAVQGAWAWPNA